MSNNLAKEPLLQTLADLIQINSVNPNYEGGVGEIEVADYVERFFFERGIETWRQELYPDRPNVLARIPGRRPDRRIVLEAHMDTFSVTGMTIDPWRAELRDGRMYGRGACDTKGGMAAMMHAVASLKLEAVQPPCDVLFAATIDEEYSYRGVFALCHSIEPGPVDPEILKGPFAPKNPLTAEAAIVAEPTGLCPIIASKGLIRWKIETRGKSAHSAKPHLGVNAIEHMAPIISALSADTETLSESTHPLLGPPTCNIGTVHGGVEVNSVPDRCIIEIDRRLLPGESEPQVLEHYRNLVARVAEEHSDDDQGNIDVVMHPPMLSDRPLETDIDSSAVQTIVRVLKDLGHDATPAGVAFCTDASKFGAVGIPSLILGPGSIDQAHGAIEYIDCQQVLQASEIYRRFLMEFE